MENIILLHGALGTSAELFKLEEKLKAHAFSVFSLDFSGHGAMPFANDFGIPQFTSELEMFITANGLAGASAFGYSMGGVVALNLAAQKPGLLKKIITYGTKFNWTAEITKKEAGRCGVDFLEQKAPEFFKILEKRHFNAKHLLDKTAEMIRNFSELNHLPLEKLATIDCDVMLGMGDKDKLVFLEETTTIFKVLKSGSLYVLPNCLHQLESADPQVLADMIRTFVFPTKS